MRPTAPLIFVVGSILLPSTTTAQAVAFDAALVGTWTTKSQKVITGSSFYDPATDTLIEPALTGISYSFDAEGNYEEAYYRAVSNPVSPSCPSAVMQWQHGLATLYANGSLQLNPIAIDGRELQSEPCLYSNAILSYYDQPELFEKYEVGVDPYNGLQRLDMYQDGGAPMNPMWLAYNPPVMLPTTTLATSATASATAASKVKRTAERPRKRGLKTVRKRSVLERAETWFWVGIGTAGLGGVLMFCF